jgi:hypothetical protein
LIKFGDLAKRSLDFWVINPRSKSFAARPLVFEKIIPERSLTLEKIHKNPQNNSLDVWNL